MIEVLTDKFHFYKEQSMFIGEREEVFPEEVPQTFFMISDKSKSLWIQTGKLYSEYNDIIGYEYQADTTSIEHLPLLKCVCLTVYDE